MKKLFKIWVALHFLTACGTNEINDQYYKAASPTGIKQPIVNLTKANSERPIPSEEPVNSQKKFCGNEKDDL